MQLFTWLTCVLKWLRDCFFEKVEVTPPVPRAPHGLHETQWCEKIAKALNGTVEHRLSDGTRVDILLPRYAIEVDWACKWAESIGQALYYGMRTDRKAVSLLLIEDDSDQRFIERCEYVGRRVNPAVELWTLDVRTSILCKHGVQVEID